MKRMMTLALALCLTLTLAACGGSGEAADTSVPTTTAPAQLEGTVEELVEQVAAIESVDFVTAVTTLDLTDTSETGLWMIQRNTGLESGEQLAEAAIFEPMMGSLAFSLVMVRVAEGVDAKTVAEDMYNGIDTRKWVCVEADDLMVCGYGDVVMLIMVDTGTDLAAQPFVDAFQTVCGGTLDFVM